MAGSKYKNSKIEVDGIAFDSKKEARRWAELKELEKIGAISNLRRQVPYELIPNQRDAINGRVIERGIKYVADFEYFNEMLKEKVVEDVKGYRFGQAYALFKIKKKLMLWVHGIEVKEI